MEPKFMVNKWFKTLARVPSVALITIWVMSAYAVEKGLAVSTAQALTPTVSPSPVIQPSNVQSQQIWGCRAQNGTRTYVVDQLSRDANDFDMAIYVGVEHVSTYIGTVPVNVIQKDPELIGRGQTFDSTFEVNAFGKTVAFTVQDSVVGQASGRCSVQWQMADKETRRLVRQCLALAAHRFRNLAAVEEYGCETDPSSALEELQNQK